MEENIPSLKYRIEGLLFASGEPMSVNKIMEILACSVLEVESSIKELLEEYSLTNRCFDIIKKGSEGTVNYQIVTNKNISLDIQKLNNTVLEGDLTKSALETLCVVMYRGPLNRSEIDEVRGANSSYILRSLVLRGLVNRFVNPKRKNEFLYEASFDILKHLGINDLSTLPDYDKLHNFSLRDILKDAITESNKEAEAIDDIANTIIDESVNETTLDNSDLNN